MELTTRARSTLFAVRDEILGGKTEFNMGDWDHCIGGKFAEQWVKAERNPFKRFVYWMRPAFMNRHSILPLALARGASCPLFSIGSWDQRALRMCQHNIRYAAAMAIEAYIALYDQKPAPTAEEIQQANKAQQDAVARCYTHATVAIAAVTREEENELVGV